MANGFFPLFFGGLIGYILGISELKGFEEIVKWARERVNYLAYYGIVPPLLMFQKCKISEKFYREAVQAYILGMPNSSVIMSLKVLELGLKCKLNKEKAKLVDLINELEEKSQYKELAHGFRILRNLASHEKVECKEQDALEALRHISNILNRIFPFQIAYYSRECGYCKNKFVIDVDFENLFLGNTIRVKCSKCSHVDTFIIGAELGVPQVH